MLDIALLRKTVDWAAEQAALPDQDKSEWDQGHWFITGLEISRSCGTAMCMAGKIIDETRGLAGYGKAAYCIPFDAADELGVRVDEVWNREHTGSLFSYGNTIEDVRREAAALAERYGEVL